MTDVFLRYVDAVNIQVVAEPSILMELSEHFTYFANNYKFSPRYKARVWDGKIRLIHSLSGITYAGLAKRIKKFCESRDYTVSWDNELYYDNVSVKEIEEFIKTLNIPEQFSNRDYQLESIVKCIRSKRRTLLSPTSSGKSLMIYILTRWYEKEGKALIIVPTTGLVKQMASDFADYGYTGEIHKSTDGLNKKGDIKEPIVITTWQSLNNGKNKLPVSWYEPFRLVFGDEAHGSKALSTVQILSSLKKCKYRFGTTGTLDGDPLNETTIEGLFGPKFSAITTRELIDQGYATNVLIKCIVLKYPESVCKEFHKGEYDTKTGKYKKRSYQDEVNFIVNNEVRNKFIKNLTLSLDGNKLLFFKIIDHGKELYRLLKEKNGNVFYIDGGVDSDDREAIRHAIEEENNATLVASTGTTATGVNIKKLHHMIMGFPSKARIKLLQAIGRMLRQHETKDRAILYDIVDDLSYKSKRNYTLEHFIERTKIYDSEKFEYKIYNLILK